MNDVLRKRDQIIAKVKAKYWRATHKFGVQVPKSIDKALKIDHKAGTTFWKKSIEKEMANVRVAFNVLKIVKLDQMIEGKVKPGFKNMLEHT